MQRSLHPALAETYRQKVDRLHQALSQDEERGEAANILRGLIDEIRLVPKEGVLGIYLVGNLATILALSTKQNPGPCGTGVLLTLVAGTRSQRDLCLNSAPVSPAPKCGPQTKNTISQKGSYTNRENLFPNAAPRRR